MHYFCPRLTRKLRNTGIYGNNDGTALYSLQICNNVSDAEPRLAMASGSEESCCTSRNGCSLGLMWLYHVNSLAHTEHFLVAFHQTACSHMQGHAKTFACQGTVYRNFQLRQIAESMKSDAYNAVSVGMFDSTIACAHLM